MDDLGVIIFVVRKGFNDKYIPRNALEKHWPGDVDLIDNILIFLYLQWIKPTVDESLILGYT